LLAGCVIADGAPGAVLRPDHLAVAFGGRLLRIGGETLLVDDHGHGHGDGHSHDDVGHRHLHQPEHAAEHADDAADHERR
ncbi:MAG: hypothetical protein ACM3MM_10810, partial [Acidobacteriota bacterium]